MAIHAIVVMNTTGAARLTKFYVPLPPAAQQAFVRDAHVLIARRPEGVCNIIASVASADAVGDGAGGGGGGSGDWARCFPGGGGGSGSGGAAASAAAPSSEGVRLIYRQYATLFFVAAVDETESALGIMDLLQVLVETLDQCFENVCELDLIFHMDKVHYVIDEIIVGGLVMETNMADILAALQTSKREELASAGGGTGLAAGVASSFGGNFIKK